MKEKIKEFFKDACIIFTVFTFILSIGYSLVYMGVEAEHNMPGFAFETLLFLFMCAVLMRIYHNVLKVNSIPMALRILLNYLLVTLTAFALIVLLTGGKVNKSFAFFFISLLSLVYIIFVIFFVVASSRKKEKANNKKAYKSIIK